MSHRSSVFEAAFNLIVSGTVRVANYPMLSLPNGKCSLLEALDELASKERKLNR